ncbi:MAG: AAA family ATPase, partial [Gemmatimonadaceae bacterium]
EGEARQGVRRAEENREQLARGCARVEREQANVDTLLERLATRRGELAVRIASLDEERARSEQDIAREEEGASAARDRLAELECLLDAARDERTRCQVEQAQVQARLQVAQDRERRLDEEVSSASARLQSLLSEITDLSQADSVLARRMAEWELDRDARRAALGDGEALLAGAEEAVRAADEHLDRTEHALDESHRQAGALSEELHHAELRLSELAGRRTAIRERLEAEWRRPLEEMLRSITPVELDEDSLRAQVTALREELENIGPVNPLAIEEHEEEVKRLDFLTTQRADLTAARNSLQQAIREIDTTARELFLATFAQVRENFRQIFITLFGGGECDLRLENPETPLECDIEIHASPRGKRTQRIHLLSSGERALVALSLLFGIFLTKPSPFCLLDEVDAPLDDQNVGRFVRMLNEFKMNTQFIVITHNPRTTTEAADAVYGVTMQEPGVSSFVSVRMRGAALDDGEDAVLEGVEAEPASV